MRGRSSGKTGPPVPGLTRVGGGAIRSGLFGLESITLKRVVQRGRSRCRLVISVARGETRLESDVALFLTPDLTGVGT